MTASDKRQSDTQSGLDTARREIAQLLSPAITRVAASYGDFARQLAEATAKPDAFARHHRAARTALAHLEALVKLGRWAVALPGGEDDLADEAALAALIGEARAALAGVPPDQPGDGAADGP